MTDNDTADALIDAIRAAQPTVIRITSVPTPGNRVVLVVEQIDKEDNTMNTNRPTIVCLCGSTRFFTAFQKANYEETMSGKIVLSVGFYPHSQDQAHGEQVGCTAEQKEALDQLHLRKIDMADEVLVLNVGGYVGESTTREIKYAVDNGCLVRWLEPDNKPDWYTADYN